MASAHDVDEIRSALRGSRVLAGTRLCVQFYGVPIEDPSLSPMFLSELARYAFLEIGAAELSLCNLPVTSARLDSARWELGPTRYVLVAHQILWDDDEHASYLDAVRRYALYGHAGVLPADDSALVAARVDAYKHTHPRRGHLDAGALVDVVREQLPLSHA
ncbi:hypothetical protein [Cellulosimicrobium cellulans]|uniref:hypothetical protein n=1 Tax=Cellulosimicrobium cellulans TaxID=1710 RepID=UPI0005B7999D|nr:hypothetical protein [Cellulosimicrobium cellulans]